MQFRLNDLVGGWSARQEGAPPPWFWHLFLGFSVLWVIASMAIPAVDDDEPPEGVMTYRDGNLECWDKVVCCNPSREETCTRIPICRQVE